MKDEELKILKLKADCFDRIVEKYNNLQEDTGFYSKNWVELAEVIEDEIKKCARDGNWGQTTHSPISEIGE